MSLSIIIPVFNEDQSIINVLNELLPIAQLNHWKIIVVNDGSSDNTSSELEKIDDILLINHDYNKGYGASLKIGIRNSDTEWVAFFDADGQHRSEDLLSMFNVRNNYDMLVGMRGIDSHHERIRVFGKWILSKVANFLTGSKIPDLNSGLRIVKKEVILKMLHLFPDGFSFSTTSTIAFLNMGYNVGYVPIRVNKRVGKSTVNQFKHGSNTLLLILRLIALFNPLKVFIPLSVFLFFAGLIYEIIWGILLLQNIKMLAGAILLILSGLIVFLFGIMTDQISALRKQSDFK